MSVDNNHDWKADALNLYMGLRNSEIKKDVFIVKAKQQYGISEKTAEQWYSFAWENHENRILDYVDPTGDLVDPIKSAETLSASVDKLTKVLVSQRNTVQNSTVAPLDERVRLVNNLSDLKSKLKDLKKIVRTMFNLNDDDDDDNDLDLEEDGEYDGYEYYDDADGQRLRKPMTQQQILDEVDSKIADFADDNAYIQKNLVNAIELLNADYEQDMEDLYKLYTTISDFKMNVKKVKKILKRVKAFRF